MKENNKRTVFAPQPVLVSASIPSNRVISVKLNSDEDIDWTWMSLPDGTRYVGGYRIVKKID